MRSIRQNPPFTATKVLTEFFLNDHLKRSLRMAQDMIEVLKVLIPKQALINGQ